MEKFRQTKIVCTLGPSSESEGVLERMISAGMNVARLNFSHGSHEEHGARIARLRKVAKKLGRTVAILQDLSGPKIRLGEVEGTVQLESGATFMLTERKVQGNAEMATVQFRGLGKVVRKNDTILLNDGCVELRVESVEAHGIRCNVVNGGPISSHKGVNLPVRSTGIATLTPKDRADMKFGLEQGVDCLALSFVRTGRDVALARRHARSLGHETAFIAKIEKPEALENIDAIIAEADGVMVARGDLGVETPYEQVPVAERMIIAKANAAGKPVITATQMLESMINSPRPTRAEVTDVFGAVMIGTDAVMLSAESAAGQYPVESVAALARIAREAELHFPYATWSDQLPRNPDMCISEAIARQAVKIAETIKASLMVVHSVSGGTARWVAKYRPSMPVVAVSDVPVVCRRLALSRGVVPFEVSKLHDHVDFFKAVVRTTKARIALKKGARIVVTYGHPFNLAGGTDAVRVIIAD